MADYDDDMHLGVYERGGAALLLSRLLLSRLSLLLGLACAACGSAKDRSYVDSATSDAGGNGGTTSSDETLSTGETTSPSDGGAGATNDAAATTTDGSGGDGLGGSVGGGGSAGGQGGDNDGNTHSGGASGSPGTETTSTDTSTTGTVVEPPFVPGPAGLDVVAGGSVVQSPRFTLVMSVGQSPGGNAWLDSSRFSLAGGLVGTMR